MRYAFDDASLNSHYNDLRQATPCLGAGHTLAAPRGGVGHTLAAPRGGLGPLGAHRPRPSTYKLPPDVKTLNKSASIH
jgi:ribosomal protein S27E